MTSPPVDVRARTRPPTRRTALVAGIAIALTGLLGTAGAGAAPRPLSPRAVASNVAFPSPTWIDSLGVEAISSPTVATIDGVQAIVFGSQSGYLYVVDAANGRSLPGWPEPVQLGPGTPSAIESSPTVAYLDGAGKPPSIIVGAGSTYVANQQGGLVAFNADGSVRFTFKTQDVYNEWTNAARPDGYREAVFSTPAVGDVTGNGQLDVVFGSWDHRIYALSARGKLVPGFPINNEDTIWSSPALYHVHGPPGAEDILIGGDGSGRKGCYGGWLMDYSYARGAPRLRWEHCEQQTIWSSPAVGVLDGSGRAAVVVGTGFGYPPPYKPGAFRIYAYYIDNGARVPGWPVTTAGPAFGSPAIGTLPGSNLPAVVSTSWCTTCAGAGVPGQGESKVYAFSGSGAPLWSQTLEGANDFSSPVLADLTGSGVNNVVVGSSAGLYALDGSSGAFLFQTSMTAAINNCSMQSTAAVVDVEPGSPAGQALLGEPPAGSPAYGWHLFETCGGPKQVTPSGKLIDYPLPAAPAVAPPWPMWRQDPAHTGVAISTLPRLRSHSH